MTTTMVWSVMLAVLTLVFLAPHGAWCWEDGASLGSGALDLPWQDELCCDSPPADRSVEEGGTNASETNRSQSANLPHHPHCDYRSSTTQSHPHEPSGGTCLDILCRIDENWGNLICDLQSRGQSSGRLNSGLMAVSLQRLLSQTEDTAVKDPASDNPIVCEAEDSFTCSITLDSTASFVTMVTVSIADAVAPPVLLRVPARPKKPSPPVNLSHIQTIEAELIVHWDDPSDFGTGPLRYEVRYSSSTTHPVWQVVSASGEPRSSLDLKPLLNYTIQVRCSGLDGPLLWSEWSEPHHIRLNMVSYIPKTVVARPGENVTVYCVFNDRSIDASSAVWMLNNDQPLHRSLYHPVNQWVSKITVRPSKTQMYDLLRCTQQWSRPYSEIYVEGAFIDIKCVTNGDVSAMDCSWTNTQWAKLKFRSKWDDLTCDMMEEQERAGESSGNMGPTCQDDKNSCSIRPVRTNCYKLWLELPSRLGTIRSKPVYVSPLDYVKPNPPRNISAVTQSSGVLRVTWEPPSLPLEGPQCQFRYHSPSTVEAQMQKKVQNPVQVPWAEVVVPDMCRVYVVEVRCMYTSGLGNWSDWSGSVYSTPQNSRAPERGPDFWRVLQDNPYRNQTKVTLLFKHYPVSGDSYCVDGFIVKHQASSGFVWQEYIDRLSSYSFEWNQEVQTVTVEAYNSLGSSTDNTHMTLERQPKRPCVRSFQVTVINSTCVSLSWSLLNHSFVPLSMVVQWSPKRHQDSRDSDPSGESWTRLPYTDHPVYITGDFYGSEEYGFHLYPVFAEGEGEPVYTLATRGDPAAYVLLMIISFLSIVLFVTLIISQNQMKKFVWKDVPNPNNCSWAKDLDFKQVDTFDHLFRPPEGLPAWPLLLPPENISDVVIVDKTVTTGLIQTPLVSLTCDPAAALAISLSPGFDPKVDHFMESETFLGEAPSININLDELQSVDPSADQPPAESSAQSSVTYATVLLSDPNQQPIELQYKDGSGSSSSDEGNFSANNSDISGSFPGGLWELDSCRGGEMDDPRRSCSYNSVEELSETSEQEDEGEVRHEKDLYYLGMNYPAEDEQSEEEEETKTELLKNVVLNRGDCSVESYPLLGLEISNEPGELLSTTCGFSSLYLPQLRTAPCTRQPTAQQDG